MVYPTSSQQLVYNKQQNNCSVDDSNNCSVNVNENITVEPNISRYLIPSQKQQPEPTFSYTDISFRKILPQGVEEQKYRPVFNVGNRLSFSNTNYFFWEKNSPEFCNNWGSIEDYLKYNKNLELRVYTDHRLVADKLNKHAQRAITQQQIEHPPKVDPFDLSVVRGDDNFFASVVNEFDDLHTFSPTMVNEAIETPTLDNTSADNEILLVKALVESSSNVLTQTKTTEKSGIAYTKGNRNSMEDRCITTSFDIDINGEPHNVHLFGVFDGHGGTNCVDFVTSHIVGYVKDFLEAFNKNGLSDCGIMSALKIAMVALSWEFVETNPKIKMNSDIKNTSGTTANVAILLNNELWVTNVGDSRCLLVKDDEIQQLSVDITPYEALRKIRARGGTVTRYRNHGPRTMSRLGMGTAIGDHHLSSVSSRPSVTRYKYDEFHGSTLVQVSDGVTSVATTDQIGALVIECIKKGKSVDSIAAIVVAGAYQADSKDNITCVISKLTDQI